MFPMIIFFAIGVMIGFVLGVIVIASEPEIDGGMSAYQEGWNAGYEHAKEQIGKKQG